MKISRIPIFAVCFAVGLAVVSESSMAKRERSSSSRSSSAEQLPSNANPNSTGYPNGRPFQAIKVDFEELHDRFDIIDADLDQIAQNLIRIGQAVVRTEANTNTIIRAISDLDTDIGDLADAVDDVATDVTLLKNTLEVQVSANSATDSGVTLYVQVIRNGIGVDLLPQTAFTYGNSFPMTAEANTCEEIGCFEEGVGGLYAIKLVVNESDQTFAGTLLVNDADGAGTSLVTFDIPAVPAVEPAP